MECLYNLLTMATCMECLSASLYTATVWMPIFRAVRMIRQAISPPVRDQDLLYWLDRYKCNGKIHWWILRVKSFEFKEFKLGYIVIGADY